MYPIRSRSKVTAAVGITVVCIAAVVLALATQVALPGYIVGIALAAFVAGAVAVLIGA